MKIKIISLICVLVLFLTQLSACAGEPLVFDTTNTTSTSESSAITDTITTKEEICDSGMVETTSPVTDVLPPASDTQAAPPSPPTVTTVPPLVTEPEPETTEADDKPGEVIMESISNCLRSNAADPWVFYENGWYYLFISGDNRLKMRKAHTLKELGARTGSFIETTVVTMPSGTMYSENLWSPEVHYFSADDFGAEYEGWYLFIAADDGDNVNHRMYVMKSLSDTPDGPWVHPESGIQNNPQKILAPDDNTINETWAAGMSLLRYNGKCYAMWIGEEGRETLNFSQYLYINEMTNPWTLKGKKAEFCSPDYSWEKGGSGKGGDGKIRPMVVEGATAVYGDNGEIYVVYSGSGYWTTEYKLGQLTLVGDDPLIKSNWEKSMYPILQKSDVVNGCGHASFFTMADGMTKLICYHAYTGKDTKSGRGAYIDTYKIENGRIIIGDGTGRPQPNGSMIELPKEGRE